MVVIYSPWEGGLTYWCQTVSDNATTSREGYTIHGIPYILVARNYLCIMHELFSNYDIPCTHSTFIANNGNDGGAVSTAYLPLSFRGSNTFAENRGRTFVVMYEQSANHILLLY